MIIAGVNEGQTRLGKPLKDGGAALIADGKLVYASSEERHTRRKSAGGFQSSLSFGLSSIDRHRADYVFSSSCCERVPRSNSRSFIDHHLSHAALAFFASGSDRSLIIVADAGGNVLSPKGRQNEWWLHERQQLSVYLGAGGDLRLLANYFHKPGACGLGEMYRAFTHYLGWDSGNKAGKVMALAGQAVDMEKSADMYEAQSDGDLRQKFPIFEPLKPSNTARDTLLSLGRDDLVLRWEKLQDNSVRPEIAGIAQYQLESTIQGIVERHLIEHRVNHICLSGGVALNCTSAHRLRSKLGVQVFVPPGAGDNGQCVGNAIWGYHVLFGDLPDLTDLVFLGGKWQTSECKVMALVKEYGLNATVRKVHDFSHLAEITAQRIYQGEIVFWFQGGAEFGARALGNRSILASPHQPGIKLRLNELKRRESFNPFAASCIYEDSHRFFVDSEDSPYMTMAFEVRPQAVLDIPEVVHVDGTCRAQIFKRDFNPRYYDLLLQLKSLSGAGLVLNTSLNGSGDPIVESVDDAIELFARTEGVMTLVIDDFIVEKQCFK